MTATFDRAFIALGVDAHDLTSVKGRSAIYAGLMVMAVAGVTLLGGICSNLASGPIA